MLDRSGLEHSTCECYSVVKTEYDRLLPARLASNELVMTQELIANMLGVRREGVTEAAGKLQQEGLIQYSRGRITVLDRAALEARVCECYSVVKQEYDRLLPAALAGPI